MSKLQRGILALKEAQVEISEVANVIGILVCDGHISVHVRNLRDLEQVPGDVAYKIETGRDYPVRAVKMYEGVEFFCLMRWEEYKEAV